MTPHKGREEFAFLVPDFNGPPPLGEAGLFFVRHAMTRQVRDTDQMLVVPIDPATLADAFANTDNPAGVWRVHYDGEMPMISEDDRHVLEVVGEIPGGCLVRMGTEANDPFGLGDILMGREEAEMAALEAARNRALDIVTSLGGLAARRSKGRWRPVAPADRATWGAHLVAWNTQKMRADAAFERSMRPCRVAAGVVTTALKAA